MQHHILLHIFTRIMTQHTILLPFLAQGVQVALHVLTQLNGGGGINMVLHMVTRLTSMLWYQSMRQKSSTVLTSGPCAAM